MTVLRVLMVAMLMQAKPAVAKAAGGSISAAHGKQRAASHLAP
jgi:hypothetical protein